MESSDYGVRSLDSIYSLSDSTTSASSTSSAACDEPTPLLSSDELLRLEPSSGESTASRSTTFTADDAEGDAATSASSDGPTSHRPPPLDPPHPLTHFLLSSLQSLPASPSSSSIPASATSSPSLHGIGRGRSSSTRSSGGSSSGASRDISELVMPSMLLPSGRESSSSARGGGGTRTQDEDRARLLVVGRSDEEVNALGRLLRDRTRGRKSSSATGEGESERDMSGSFLDQLAPPSTASAGVTSGAGVSGAFDDLISVGGETGGGLLEEMGQADDAKLFKVVGGVGSMDLAKQLLSSLERLDSMINPHFPTSKVLSDLVKGGVNCRIEGCLMMFSSPPLPHEIVTARHISLLVPIFPILVLPPSPTSKPQKCGAIIRAVCSQLSAAGIRYTPAFESVVEGRHCPLFVLPQALLSRDYTDSDPGSSAMSSLASSQELRPPFQSQGHSPPTTTTTGDLGRLISLVSSPLLRERIKNNFVVAFLEWREINAAAKGVRFWRMDELPREWKGTNLDEGDRSHQQWGLDFSKRVAERRRVINLARRESEVEVDLLAEEKQDAWPSSEPMHRSLTEMATPRTERPAIPDDDLPLLPTHHDDHFSDSFLSHSIDPFHLPSLLHLVGLNLRLSLLTGTVSETDAFEQDKGMNRLQVGRLIGTAAIVGFVFFTGFVCGKCGGIGGVWREVLRSGVVAWSRTYW